LEPRTSKNTLKHELLAQSSPTNTIKLEYLEPWALRDTIKHGLFAHPRPKKHKKTKVIGALDLKKIR
jgi:hypothetical protein